MRLLLTGGNVFYDGAFKRQSLLLDGGLVIFPSSEAAIEKVDRIYQLNNMYIVPGFADVHVHLREPGFSYKETIHTGTLAAAKGGYTAVCSMPNLEPVPDCLENLKVQTDIIEREALVDVFPYASITKGRTGAGQLSDIAALADKVIAFTDDGSGVADESVMRRAMLEVKKHSSMIAAHCEDVSLIKKGGCIHDGLYAKTHGFAGISSESEYEQLKRDIALAKETGCKYHVCHVSTWQSVEAIRRAKEEGVDITCETAPHYLVLCEDDLIDEGRFKMNPPLRSLRDKLALIEGLKDGTIDIIATDHAPHSAEEKAKGLKDSAMGISGLEAAFGVLYTHLVRTGVISLETLMDKLSAAPRKIFKLPDNAIKEGKLADITVFETQTPYELKSETFLSKGKATPFEGDTLYGKIYMTIHNGRVVWEKNSQKN